MMTELELNEIEEILMVTPINDSTLQSINLDSGRQKVQNDSADKKSATNAQTSIVAQGVNFSVGTKVLDEIKNTIQTGSEIDWTRVNTLKDAVDSGTYQSNSAQIASKLLNSDVVETA